VLFAVNPARSRASLELEVVLFGRHIALAALALTHNLLLLRKSLEGVTGSVGEARINSTRTPALVGTNGFMVASVAELVVIIHTLVGTYLAYGIFLLALATQTELLECSVVVPHANILGIVRYGTFTALDFVGSLEHRGLGDWLLVLLRIFLTVAVVAGQLVLTEGVPESAVGSWLDATRPAHSLFPRHRRRRRRSTGWHDSTPVGLGRRKSESGSHSVVGSHYFISCCYCCLLLVVVFELPSHITYKFISTFWSKILSLNSSNNRIRR
jgi:hypothetical protein